MTTVFDTLLVLLFMKFLYETVSAKLLPCPLFIVSMIGLPFLLGLGGRYGYKVLRDGVAIAGLIIFIWIHASHGFQAAYLIMIVLGFLIYIMGRLAQRMFKSMIIATLIIIVIIYILVRANIG